MCFTFGNKMKSLILIVAVFVIFCLLAYYADPLVLFIAAWGLSFWICLPCVLLGSLILLLACRRGTSLRPGLTFIAVILSVPALLFAAIPANAYIQNQAEAEAKAYPARVAPLLEQYRVKTGAYPATLDALPSKPAVPRLLRTNYGYRSHGSRYSFTFSRPGGLIDVWDFDSVTQQWHLST